MNRNEFISKVKERYPDYAQFDDDILWEKLNEKYGSQLDAYEIDADPVENGLVGFPSKKSENFQKDTNKELD